MRSLFSTFAHGPPGVGLLLMRLASGIGLMVDAITVLGNGPSLETALLHGVTGVLGALLLAGLWTSIAGALVAVASLWMFFSLDHPWRWILLATLGAALTLLGPGVWSLDARLFGWRRLESRAQKGQPTPPQ